MFIRGLFAPGFLSSWPCAWAAVQILDLPAKPAGLSIQNQRGEDENKNKTPTPGDVRILMAARYLESLQCEFRIKKIYISERGRFSKPLLIAPGKGLNISANFSIIFCKSWAAQVPGGLCNKTRWLKGMFLH